MQNYEVYGEPYPPAIYSNKIVLTPPAPGNVRTSLWSNKQHWNPRWSAELEFRATGPDAGSGRLQLWLAKKGKEVIGQSSIYSVGRWEGLAIVVDQYAGSGGMVRGFLSDGSKDYKRVPSVDALAFGHCSYSYRNLGRPSSIKLEHTDHTFKVIVDGKGCFETNQVRIPSGYQFGITATSAENPDSFEVFKLAVATDRTARAPEQQPVVNQRDEQKNGQQQGGNSRTGYLSSDRIPDVKDIPEVSASEIDNSKEFADLHYRLQSLMRHMVNFQGDFQRFQVSQSAESKKMAETLASLADHAMGRKFPYEQITAMDRRLEVMETQVREIKRDMLSYNQKLQPQLESIRRTLGNSHTMILEGVHDKVGGLMSNVPKLSVIMLVVFGSQAFLVAAFLYYKRRKAMGPKKYL